MVSYATIDKNNQVSILFHNCLCTYSNNCLKSFVGQGEIYVLSLLLFYYCIFLRIHPIYIRDNKTNIENLQQINL